MPRTGLGAERVGQWTRLCPSRRLDGSTAPWWTPPNDPTEPTLRMAIAPTGVAAKPPAAGASIASRFGEITPAFAAAFGAGST